MEMGRKEKCMRSKNTQNGDPTTLLSLPPYYDSACHCLLLLVIQCRPISHLGDAAVEGQAASREVQLLQAQLQPHCGNL